MTSVKVSRKIEGYTLQLNDDGCEAVISVDDQCRRCHITYYDQREHPSLLTAITRSPIEEMSVVELVDLIGFDAKLFPLLFSGNPNQVANAIVSLQILCERAVVQAAQVDMQGRNRIVSAACALWQSISKDPLHNDVQITPIVVAMLMNTQNRINTLPVPSM